MKQHRICLLFLLPVATLLAGEPANRKIEATDAAVCVKNGDRLVIEYVYGKDLSRPYVRQLCTPGGVNFLRDNVADHIHHHGLMFALQADAVDFWAETKGCGREVHRTFPKLGKMAASDEDVDYAAVNEAVDWLAPGQEKPLVEETRTIVVHGGAGDATLLTWRSDLQVGEGKAAVKLSGHHYYGLGMRFLKSMDGAEFFTAKGKVDGAIVRNDERLTPGHWCACRAQVDGKPVTVAMFDAPANPRPALWFTMAKQFSYLSATINLWKEPFTLESGKPFALTYGVAAWDGKASPETIEKMYKQWLKLGETIRARPEPPTQPAK